MIVNTKTYFQSKSQIPFLNTGFIGFPGLGIYTGRDVDYKKVVRFVRKSPEAMGILKSLVTDVISDGVHFTASGQGKKRNKEEAGRFIDSNYFMQELEASLYDYFMLGNFLIWKGGFLSAELKEIKSKIPLWSFDHKQILDEATSSLRKARHVPWTSVRILTSRTRIVGYQQEASTETNIVDSVGQPIKDKYGNVGFGKVEWSVEEVIHHRMISLDGGVYGIAPMLSLLPVVSTLQLLKDYHGYFFD